MAELTFCERTTFYTLCNALDKIHCADSLHVKADIMRQFISSFREQSRNDSFYPILRLILPEQDLERGPYGIKEHSLALAYIRILCLSKKSSDALKLQNYKVTQTAGSGIGDFADVAFWVLRSRRSMLDKRENCLNIYQVNKHLDNIATKHAEHKPREVDDELQAMILEMSALEQKWLIRILLKDLHLGLSRGKILSLFHPDANDLFDVNSSIEKVCTTLKDPSIRLNEIGISIFQHFRPMLSQRCDVEAIDKDIPELDRYFVEIKFDGERFQMHYRNDEFKYLSRNGFDYTNTFGCNTSNGIFTPKLAKRLSPTVKNCILDGEMMCWNSVKKKFTFKGKNIDVKKLQQGHHNQPCFVVFDILYLNDKVLTNVSLEERLKILEGIIQPEEGVLLLSAKDVVTTSEEIARILKLTIDNCEEGIIVKNPFSVYKPNARNAGWYKIKPEYTEGLMVELDVLIIGGYYGEGRRRGVISQFLLALADSKKNEENEPIQFYSLGRVGSGASNAELEELHNKICNAWEKVYPHQMPPRIQWSKEKPDVWIKPQSSVILQVKATEVIKSDSFKVGYTLRFPRIQKIRYDKAWHECLSMQEFTEIRQRYSGKLTADSSNVNRKSSSPKRKVKRTKKVLTIDEEFQSKRPRDLQSLSTLFENKEFCVLTDANNSYTKNELEKKILQHGGTIVQNPGLSTYCVVASCKNIRVNNVINSNKFDVVNTDWLVECIDRNSFRKWRPGDFLFVTPTTSEQLSQDYDCYGDSYSEPIDENRLKFILDSMQVDETSGNITYEDKIDLDKELFESKNPFGVFRGCYVFFHTTLETKEREYEYRMYKSMLKFQGGFHQDAIDQKTTHIVYLKGTLPMTLPDTSIIVVNKEWIDDSWKAKSRLPEKYYSLGS